MKVTAYSIAPSEKELLAKANQKKHEITLIANELSLETSGFAQGKDAVIVYKDQITTAMLEDLSRLGIRFILIPAGALNTDIKQTAARLNIKLASALSGSPEAAACVVQSLDLYEANKCLGKSCLRTTNCRSANRA